MACPGTEASPYNEDEELHASQKLEVMDQKTFGRALELEASGEPRKKVVGRFTGSPRKGLGEMKISIFLSLPSELK